jgi:uncharacterized protein
MLLIFLHYFLIGTLAGMMSGLLGVGSGVVVVPALAFLFRRQQFPIQLIMHMAAGTSLASMVVTTSRSLLSHVRRHIKFWSIYKRFMPTVIIGTIAGAVLAYYLPSFALRIIFGIVLLFFSIKMFFQKSPDTDKHNLPGNLGCWSMGFLIGGKSGLLGLGGGTFSIPFLTHCSVPMRQALVVSTAIGVTVSVVGAVSFMLTGLHTVGLPAWSTGYVYWPAWLGVITGSLCFVPLGVKLSHWLPTLILKRIFSTFLLIVGVHMLYVFK